MPKFTDSEGLLPFQKPGDYILRVLSFDKGLSKGSKTNGCDLYELKIEVQNPISGQPNSTLYENLIDTESLVWKWDTFLKSCGVKIDKGEEYTFDADDAAHKNIRFIDVIGMRGWATIRMKQPQNAGDQPRYNEVAAWLTNKEKLAPIKPEVVPEKEDDIPF